VIGFCFDLTRLYFVHLEKNLHPYWQLFFGSLNVRGYNEENLFLTDSSLGEGY
jgi:hypothetical protein